MSFEVFGEILGANVWPLAFIFIALLVLRQLRDDVRPIFSGVVTGLAKNAQANALALAIAFAFGLSASFSAFWDVFNNLGKEEFAHMSWHQYAALWTKVMNPFIVAALARLVPQAPAEKVANGTVPPFTPKA